MIRYISIECTSQNRHGRYRKITNSLFKFIHVYSIIEVIRATVLLCIQYRYLSLLHMLINNSMDIIDIIVSNPEYVYRYPGEYEEHLERPISVIQSSIVGRCTSIRNFYPHRYLRGRSEFIVHTDWWCDAYKGVIIIDAEFIKSIKSKIHGDLLMIEEHADDRYAVKIYDVPETIYIIPDIQIRCNRNNFQYQFNSDSGNLLLLNNIIPCC